MHIEKNDLKLVNFPFIQSIEQIVKIEGRLQLNKKKVIKPFYLEKTKEK